MAPIIRSIDFNAQQDCFAVGTDSGVRVFNCDPLVELRNINFTTVGSVKLCTLLHRTNLIAIVGGGSQPKFAENTGDRVVIDKRANIYMISVLIWDDSIKKFVLEVTVSSPVLNIILTSTKLVIVLALQIHIFSFPNPCQRLRTEETRMNSYGLCQMSVDSHSELIVYPGFKTGSIQLVDLRNVSRGSSLAPITINAHQSEIVRLALNNQATLVATGSVKGTVVRIFDTRTRALQSEFRRGADPANLHCLRFSPCSSFLAVSSDKGTVHIFTVRDKNDDKWSNRRTILQQVGLVAEDARRSVAQFSLPDANTQCECGFQTSVGGRQSVIALCNDGTYHRFTFTSDGNCTREGFDHFLDLGDEQEFWTDINWAVQSSI